MNEKAAKELDGSVEVWVHFSAEPLQQGYRVFTVFYQRIMCVYLQKIIISVDVLGQPIHWKTFTYCLCMKIRCDYLSCFSFS